MFIGSVFVLEHKKKKTHQNKQPYLPLGGVKGQRLCDKASDVELREERRCGDVRGVSGDGAGVRHTHTHRWSVSPPSRLFLQS